MGEMPATIVVPPKGLDARTEESSLKIGIRHCSGSIFVFAVRRALILKALHGKFQYLTTTHSMSMIAAFSQQATL